MSTIEPVKAMTEPWDARSRAPARVLMPQNATPIVPGGSIAGRSLTAVVAIMTFLAALTAGAVAMAVASASGWQSAVGREVTIQIKPVAGRNMDADVRAAVALARGAPGIANVRAYTKEQSEQLVEPWLGSGLSLDELPIPRMIVVKLGSSASPDFSALRSALAAQVPSASLDDHRGWIDRMRDMAETAIVAGIAILVLVVIVTVLSVTFATRGAMATNRPIVEVLHYVGATDAFVASQFQRHFLILGLKGGAIGGGIALLLFGILGAIDAWLSGTAGGQEAAVLFGSFSVGPVGFVTILVLIVLMAGVTAVTSRRIVDQTLKSFE
ncbi:MAG: ABC transporter permease [Xanthobacteraceae bacterium]